MNQVLSENPNANVSASPEFLIEGEDYYLEHGLLVMTAAYHRKRGSCCGSGCRCCPFEPHHEAGATKLALVGAPMIEGEVDRING
jgi:hypothetical protein